MLWLIFGLRQTSGNTRYLWIYLYCFDSISRKINNFRTNLIPTKPFLEKKKPNTCRRPTTKKKITIHSKIKATLSLSLFSAAIIKDTARPSYWVPDSEVVCCCCCETMFSDAVPLHHCRDCGRGVCQDCSQHRKPVPRRGWDNPVRVCDACTKID